MRSSIRRLHTAVAVAAALVLAPGCRRGEKPPLDPVGVLKRGARPGFEAPADGVLKPEQVERFLRVRGRARTESMAQALAAASVDPEEYGWVRARIQEALLALDTERVVAASSEAYARAIAGLREARRSARDAKTAARLDAEIATLERERANLRRRPPPPSSVQRNTALVSRRRSQIEAAGP